MSRGDVTQTRLKPEEEITPLSVDVYYKLKATKNIYLKRMNPPIINSTNSVTTSTKSKFLKKGAVCFFFKRFTHLVVNAACISFVTC